MTRSEDPMPSPEHKRPRIPCIEITPTSAQYEQLCRDLKMLRKLGAPSHTAAIVQAVHAAATDKLRHDRNESAGQR
jgi:hypothetical protein